MFQARHRPLLEGLVSLAAIGVSLVAFRVYFMGNKAPEFAPADNPASDSDSLLTRTLTYHYLPFLNLWLLLFPKVLSFDWSMGSVPLIENVSDLRNLCTLTFYVILVYAAVLILRHLNETRAARTSNRDTHTFKHNKHKMCNGNGYAHLNGNGTLNSHNCDSKTASASSTNSVRKRCLPKRRGSSSSSDSHEDDVDSTTGSSYLRCQQTLHLLVISLAILVFPFVPASNLFFYVGFVIAERVLYIPSMGFCLLVAQGVHTMYGAYCRQSWSKRQVLWVAVAVLLTGYGARTVQRNQDWLTEENLYRAGINVNPPKGT